MTRVQTKRAIAAASIAGAALFGACSNEGSSAEGTNQTPAISGRSGATDENPVGGAPGQGAQTRADAAGSIGPGSALSTSNVNPNTQSTKTQVDSIPDLRPDAGPGNE